jgi:SAM-dependent methyltransferase
VSEDGRVEHPATSARSVSFDRAADFYDRTRSLDPATAAAQTDLLLGQLASAPGDALEIGVGTGRISLPLAEAGARIVGVDLSPAMLERLRAKDPARMVPVLVGDASALPFPGRSFGAVLACHVLHLVADWVAVVEEVRRVLRPGGVLLVTRGAARDGLLADITQRLRAAVGAPSRRVGLDRLDALDAYVTAAGGSAELLAPVERQGGADAAAGRSVGAYLDDLAAGMYSWTWDLPADRVAAAVDDVRRWLASEYGDPTTLTLPFPPIRWHRYVFPTPA